MHRKEMRACRLLGCEMVDVRPRDPQSTVLHRPAARAAAALFHWPKVVRIRSVPEVEYAFRRDGISKPLYLR